ncbi:amino acid--[acyl-carrier-protein] ligase [Kitasatospora sp. CMC57]|uniref:Amino acid--[acyl-carrier-protein] ligase n=1 Tax=Kitasatospora sp. CMC57 TaxID=3231513 RepID=A0AB33JR78_9ACTN
MTDLHPSGAATLLPTDVPGVVLYSGAFEALIADLRLGIETLGADEPFDRIAVPPVISRALVERAGYVKAFPHLLGTVHSFTGTASEWGERSGRPDWHTAQQIGDLVLLPAACYPLYATLEGRELTEPVRFATSAHCFRQEGSHEPGRLRSFRMAEYVTAGSQQHCEEWRARWLDRVADWLAALDLKAAVEVADDPFFGRARRIFQAAQRAQELKYELRVELADGLVQAIASANCHKDTFGTVFGFTADGEPGHTACAAFGLERIALALIHAHGPHLAHWPQSVRLALTGGRGR